MSNVSVRLDCPRLLFLQQPAPLDFRRDRGIAAQAGSDRRRRSGRAKDSQWQGLSRSRRPLSRPGEIRRVGIYGRAFHRTCCRIELAPPDLLAGSFSVGFSLSGFLRRFRLCPLAGLSFGHGVFTFLGFFLEF